MDSGYIEFVGTAVVAIFFLIAILKKAFPWLAEGGSRYIPLIALALGLGVAVYCGAHWGLNWLQVLISVVIPALGSSGLHSYIGEAKGS
ncbi:MAG: hypothetical protein SWK76_16940 [Actinomycetota bacterium]|nr:hypothetical protein [Actinomycetota bacterium]